MRKLILHMMTTLDGFIADSEGRLDGGWTNWDDEMQQFYNQLFAATDTIMYGRGIYEEMVPAWAAIADGNPPPGYHVTDAERTFANRLGQITKVVVSRTLRHSEDAILRGENLVAEVLKLKATAGADILLYCGPALLATLTELRLIDQYMLYVNPITLGRGTHLFGHLRSPLSLRQNRSRTFRSGVMLMVYEPIYRAHTHPPNPIR
jgi:dihydrofolate reductase